VSKARKGGQVGYDDVAARSGPGVARGWLGKDLTPADWRIELDREAQAELRSLAGALETHEVSVEHLDISRFRLPAVGRSMARARDRLERGLGFAILDRLPIEGLPERSAKAMAWLAISQLGTIVNQKFNGQRLYEVRDTGAKLTHGVRRSITNLEQELHTDGGWLAMPPHYIALACLRQAEVGGVSRVGSMVAAHDAMQARHPELLSELYKPFWWDRQAEHAPGDPPCSQHPIFAAHDGRIVVRYYDDYVRHGHKLMGEPISEQSEMALQVLRDAVETPGWSLALRLEPGQIELVNNHLVSHARSAFEDSPKSLGRLLLRLWVREGDSIEMEPAPARHT
jgi:alpha-ketoglutarate-dependent taurine dioxygenase